MAQPRTTSIRPAARLSDAATSDVRAVRSAVGFWKADDLSLVRFTGPDAASWLQSQTTNDVLAIESGQGHAGASLDRKGRLQGHFTLHRWDDEYWMLVERGQAGPLLEHLQQFHFLEEVEWSNEADALEFIVVQGPRALPMLSELATKGVKWPNTLYGCRPVHVLDTEALAFRLSPFGEDGYVLAVESGQGEALDAQLAERGAKWGLRRLGAQARETLRIEAGEPKWGVDMDSATRISETPLERVAVDYDKGCYLGQEVVAKLRTYGSVRYALMGLICDEAATPPAGTLYVGDDKVGSLTSATWSPIFERPVALASLDRDRRVPGETLAFRCVPDQGEPVDFNAAVATLPMYQGPSRQERSQELYNEALEIFQNDSEDTDAAAIALLEEAVVLQPDHEDAYEALGVILHRHGRTDEAIERMQTLARLAPDSIMAHTNLSVFYVAKGMISEAESEKAKASALEQNREMEARQVESAAARERQRIQAEARERMEMFREVLEIDPDDSLATFGMGSAHMQLGEYAEAAPYFERAAQAQKDYSAAYLNLGKCHEFTGDMDAARESYRAGIAAAGRKGDLMPLKEMERRLAALDGL